MSIDFYCQCGRALKARDSDAGRKVRCPHCKTALDVPIPELIEAREDFNPFVADPHPQHGVVIVQSSPSQRPVSLRTPPEPWYYGLITLVAYLIIVCGVCVFGLILWNAIETAPSDAWERGIYALGFIVVTWVIAAPLLILVNAARNVRALRYRR